MRIFANLDELVAAKGEHLGYSEWRTVTQEQIDTFADVTDDHQWIHVDAEKASAGPFGKTIAHGYLTLSLIPSFGREVFRVDGLKMGLNYGLNKVRFPSVVPVDSRIRDGVELAEVNQVAQGTQVVFRHTIEIDGQPKPACVADHVVLLVA